MARTETWRTVVDGAVRLAHFSEKPLGEIRSVPHAEQLPGVKPSGLWVSDESVGAFGWRQFCASADFGIERLRCAAWIRVNPGAQILILSSDADIDRFHREYASQPWEVDWPAVAAKFAGIVITPYCWGRRLSFNTTWYYGWDCASGCIWGGGAAIAVYRRTAQGPLA